MKRDTWYRPGVVLALGVALAVVGCGGNSSEGADLTLQTSVVSRGTLESSVEATGTVEPIKSVEVRTQASGEILSMPVELGDQVIAGQVLAEVDPRNEVNALEQAQANLDQAQAELQVNESRLKRVQMLRDSGVVTTDELETATVNYANAKSALVRAQTALQLAQEQRADATVKAPISGTIIQKDVEEGQVITGTRDLTGGTVLLVLADLSNVQVRTLVDESEIGGVQAGQPASITVEAYPTRTFRGNVLKIEPQATVDQNVTMFAVLTQIGNQEGLLKPGMNADVQIVLGQRTNVLKLPNSGVKMPDEAQQLADAIGLDPALLQQRVASAEDEGSAAPADGQEPAAGGSADAGDLPTPEQLRAMSPQERRQRMQSLSQEQRRALFQRMRVSGGGFAGFAGDNGGGRTRTPAADVGAPRPAFVFVRDAQGRLTLKAVEVGLSSFDETEIVAGLAEGDTVVDVPLALIQQSQMLSRIRSRSGIPGVGGGR